MLTGINFLLRVVVGGVHKMEIVWEEGEGASSNFESYLSASHPR